MHRVHMKAKNGTTYIYEGETVWDKELKKYCTKRVCVGKIDPVTNEFIPSRRLDHTRLSNTQLINGGFSIIHIGHQIVLEKITEDLEIADILRKATPVDWRAILALVWHAVIEDEPLGACSQWLPYFRTPFEGNLSGGQIGGILDRIDTKVQSRFLREWYNRHADIENTLFDLRAISSFSTCYPSLAWGVAMEGADPPQLRFTILIGRKSRLPLHIEITDSTVHDHTVFGNHLRMMKREGYTVDRFAMDQEFYSLENISIFLKRQFKFLQAVRIQDVWICDLIDANRDMLEDNNSLYILDGRSYYTRAVPYAWETYGNGVRKKHPCTVHLFYSRDIVGKDRDRFMLRLQQEKLRLENHPDDVPDPVLSRFLLVERSKYAHHNTVAFNMDEIERHERSYAGFFAYITNDRRLRDPLEVLENYRMRRSIERTFDNLRNDVDLLRIRVHEGNRIIPRMFVQFIASIYICELRKRLKASEMANSYSIHEAMSELKMITEIYVENKPIGIRSHVSDEQTALIDALCRDSTPDSTYDNSQDINR